MEEMTLLEWSFDILLGFGLLVLSWQAMTCSDLFKGVVLFIGFSLLMALAWVRIEAPDIALAEAAIGAGLTGALLLAALAKLPSEKKEVDSTPPVKKTEAKKDLLKKLQGVPPLLAALGLGTVVFSLIPTSPGLKLEVMENLQTSGVTNPVTAVLLNFRGYDTLLEMVVLLLSVLGVWSLGGKPLQSERVPGTVLDTLSRLLVPIIILVAAYLLWRGAHGPGGAFQAGAVLGALGVLVLLAGWGFLSGPGVLFLKTVLVAGPGLFVVIAGFTFLIEGKMLKYSSTQAGTLIFILETVATFSIGLTLTILFFGTRLVDKESQ